MATDYAVIRRLSQDQCCRFIAMGHTIVDDMDGVYFLPNDLAQCQRLLLAAFQQARQLECRTAESEHKAAELNRVLGETTASYEALYKSTRPRLTSWNGISVGVRPVARAVCGGPGARALVRVGVGLGDQP